MTQRPQFFIKNNNQNEGPNTSKVNIWKWLGFSLVFVVVFAILTYGAIQCWGAYKQVSRNWAEIKFAYEKPEFVKTVREDYESKTKKLDATYLHKDKSSEEQLVDEVVKRLKTADQLK